MAQKRNEETKKRIYRNYYFWFGGGPLLIISFFICGSFLGIWGKKLSELPVFAQLVMCLLVLSIIAYLIGFLLFLNKNAEVLDEKKKKKGSTRESVFNIGIFLCIFSVINIFSTKLTLSWKILLSVPVTIILWYLLKKRRIKGGHKC